MNAADELVTGHQTHQDSHQGYGDAQGSLKEGAYATDSHPSKLAEFGDRVTDNYVNVPVQETERLNSSELTRMSIISADCVAMMEIQKPQVNQVLNIYY